MALINCKECGKEMSENATICPNCGNPNTLTKEEKQEAIKDKKENSIMLIIGTIFLIILIPILLKEFGVFDFIKDTGNLIDDTVDDYIEQKERDIQLKKDLYNILSE